MKLDKNTRMRLGERAKQRRIFLGISRAVVSAETGASDASVAQWEKLLPHKTAHDEKWESALRVPPGWIRNERMVAPEIADSASPAVSESEASTFADFILAMCTWYAKGSRRERTADYASLSPHEQRWVFIVSRRYGAADEEKSLLQAIGDEVGITRERTRQIVERGIERFEQKTPPTALIEALKAAMKTHMPFALSNPPDEVRAVLGGEQSLEGADRFCRDVFGVALVSVKAQGAHEKMVVAEDASDEALVRAVRQASVAMIRAAGAAQLYYVIGAVVADGFTVTPAQVEECARMFSGFEWIMEDEGWFWFGRGVDNRAKNGALKVLAAANRPVDIEEIYGALARARIARSSARFVPASLSLPLPVLQVLLGRFLEIVQSQFNNYRLNSPNGEMDDACDIYLSPTELSIRKVIVKHGGVVSRRVLKQELVDAGRIEQTTMDMALFTSPVFRRHDRGLWMITGYSFSAEALQAAVLEEGRLQLVDGWYEIEVTLPKSAFERGDWFAPAGTVPYLSPGEYAVEGQERTTRFVTNAVGDPYFKGIAHLAASMGFSSDTACMFGIAGHGRLLRLRPASTEIDLVALGATENEEIS